MPGGEFNFVNEMGKCKVYKDGFIELAGQSNDVYSKVQ
jgi:hypothetical protein